MMAGRQKSGAGLVSPSDIAQMAGRTRAAVSNWRANKRLGFPARAGGTDTRPLFNVDEVTAWLAKRDIAVDKRSPEVALWGAMNSARGHVRIDVIAETVVTLLVACQLADEDETAERAWADVRSADPVNIEHTYSSFAAKVERLHNGKWMGLLDLDPSTRQPSGRIITELVTFAASVRQTDRADTADQTLKRMVSAQGRVAGEHGLVDSRTSRLLAQAIHDRRPRRVYDSAMGIGELLLAVHKASPDAELIGQDINREAIRVARQRAILAGADIRAEVGDVLAFTDAPTTLAADVVVAEPPFGLRRPESVMLTDPRWQFDLPTRSSSELLWIQHALFHLAPGGRAFVVTSRGPLFRGGADRAVRANLLRAGVVETVVGLPPRMLPHTSIPLALWILRPAGDTPSEVTVIDATETEAPEDHIGRWLQQLATGGTSRDLPPHASVGTEDLLADDAVLQPERWVDGPTPSPSGIAHRFRSASDLLGSGAPTTPLDVHLPISFAHSRVATIKSLATLSPGTVNPKLADQDVSVWSSRSVRDSLNGTAVSQSDNACQGTGQDDDTAPGDIIVVSTGDTAAVVDHAGGRRVARGLHRLRLTTSELEADYVAACLMGSWNARYRSGTAIQRVDIRALEIPLLPLSEQRAVVALLQQAAEVRSHARQVESATRDLTESLLDAVRYDVKIEASQ